MLKSKVFSVVILLTVASLVLSACAPAATPTPVPPTPVLPTAVPRTESPATAAPTAQPTVRGRIMPTPIFLTGFESGVLSTKDDGPCDGISGTIGTEVAIESTIKRTGSYSLKIAPTETTAGRCYKNISTATVLVARFYLYIGTAPSHDTYIVTMVTTDGSSSTYPYLYLEPTTTKFELRSGTKTIVAEGPTYATGQWYRVDWKTDISADPWSMYAQIDGGTEFGGTVARTADTFDRFSLGTTSTNGPAHATYYDDLILSVTSGDYPIGAGQVESLLPSADGTHNNAASIVEDYLGTQVDGSTYYAYDHVNNLPMSESTVYLQPESTQVSME